MKTLVSALLVAWGFITNQECFAADCAGNGSGSGILSSHKTVLFVWAKTNDDLSSFPGWANELPTTLSDFYQIMSYNQHSVTTKVATNISGEFLVSSHSIAYYKTQYQALPPGHSYLGPWGIFVEEILLQVQQSYDANYFDDVDVIMILNTDGSAGWYYGGDPSQNNTGVGALGVDFMTANGKFFDRWSGGVGMEFSQGKSVTKWGVCHEYGHSLGLPDRRSWITNLAPMGVYSLMQNTYFYGSDAPVTPLAAIDLIELGWLNLNDPNRVQTLSISTPGTSTITLKPLRNQTGIVALKIELGPFIPELGFYEYYLISNLQQSNSMYDAIYPGSGLLIHHHYYDGYIPVDDIKCAVGLDPIANGFNKDHLDLLTNDPNFHGEGLPTDFFNPSTKDQFTPWTNPNTDGPQHEPNPGVAITNIANGANGEMMFQIKFNFNSGTITADSWWQGTETITGPTTVNTGKTLTILSGANVTLNPAAAVTLNGTLSIPSNAVISGGGTITPGSSGKILATNSSTALAANNSRKVARDASGNVHVVFENQGEVCYEKWTNGGSALSEFKRLSGGNGGHGFPCIAERDGNLYVIWQRYNGSTYSVIFRKYVSGAWSSNTTLASNIAAGNDPLPVIASPATGKLMVIFRGAATLRHRNSDDDGATWAAGANVPSSNSNDGFPSLAPTRTYWGSNYRSALAWWRSTGFIGYRYYCNGADSTGWSSATKNLSQIVPGAYTNHRYPSITPSGASGNTRLHVVWQVDNGASSAIIHRKATDWSTWPNVYSLTYYEQQQNPSVTGLAGETAELLFQNDSQDYIYKMHYDGTWWGGPTFAGNGTNPSVSTGHTQAKYAWTGASYAAPYEIKISSETLSKPNDENLDIAYHRSIAVIDTVTNAWLEVRLDQLSVKTAAAEEFAVPFDEAKEDEQTLTPANAFANLSSREVTIPAEAESLLVCATIAGENLSAVRNLSAINLEISIAGDNGVSTRLPLITVDAEKLEERKLFFSTGIARFRDKNLQMHINVSGIAEKSSLIASLGHIYEVVEEGALKSLEVSVQESTPPGYALHSFPNPFNPATQIRFSLPEENSVALRIYNLQGQMVRELLHASHPAGEYSISWDGRDELGLAAASGVYFLRLEAGKIVKAHKITLMR